MKKEILGVPEYSSIIRTPRIRIELDKWDFSRGRIVRTIDVTNYVLGYQFSKSIKGPMAIASISVLPQFADVHFLETIDPMDVVRIYEFDILKFQGYVRKAGYKGVMTPDGKPQRAVTIGVSSFGSYLTQSKIGVNLAIFKEDLPLYEASVNLAKAILDASEENLTFQQMIGMLVDAWFGYVHDIIDSDVQEEYIKTYVDFSTGVSSDDIAGFPKEVFLFNQEEQELSLWNVLMKLGEAPLNEFFFDEGPRQIHVSGKDISLSAAKTHLIVRPTPFDLTITNKTIETNRFQNMKHVTIPRSHLRGVDLNKSMEDVYSVYICAPPTFTYDDIELIATGHTEIDIDKVKKYLYVPCKQDLYYIRKCDVDETKMEDKKQVIDERVIDTVRTLKNWFSKNDEYLSGTIDCMVPARTNIDPRIGDKLAIEGLTGYFYVEELTHTWTYGKDLVATVGVTRGYNDHSPIPLKDRLFRKGIHVI